MLFYVFVGSPSADALGLPSAFGFVVAAVLVLIPIELGTLAWVGLRLHGRITPDGVVLYREPPPERLAWLVAALLAWSVVVAAAVAPLDGVLRSGAFGWVPERFVLRIGADAGSFVVLIWIAVTCVAVPVVEELYFRGYLLPRLSRLGLWAPAIEMALFAVSHFWSPWLAITRLLVFLPTVYAVWRTRSVVIAIWVHCLSNSLGAALAFAKA